MARKSESLPANLTLIRYLMKTRKLKIKELAKELGVTTEHLSRILCGHRALTIKNGEKIAKALGVTYEYLLTPDAKLFRDHISSALMEFLFKPDDLNWRYATRLLDKMGYLSGGEHRTEGATEAEEQDVDLLDEGIEPEIEE